MSPGIPDVLQLVDALFSFARTLSIDSAAMLSPALRRTVRVAPACPGSQRGENSSPCDGWPRVRLRPGRPRRLEVLSPPTVALDRAKKLPLYAREGVEHAWILDADAQTLERLRLEDGHWSLHGVHAGNDVVRAEPFGEIDVELRLLWAEPAEVISITSLAVCG